jgi:hypothetical protein
MAENQILSSLLDPPEGDATATLPGKNTARLNSANL